MSMRYQAGFLTASYFPLKTPDAPTIGTATAGNASASVTFTAPSNVGGGAITGYVVVASPGGAFGSGASSPVTVSGLTNGTAYTFRAYAINAFGSGPFSAASNSVTPVLPLQVAYTTPGTYTFVAPVGLSPATVSVVCIGGGGAGGAAPASIQYGYAGGGGGGGLGYANGISVTAGNSYTVVVGAGGIASNAKAGDSYFIDTSTVRGIGGNSGQSRTLGSSGVRLGGAGGSFVGDGGSDGGEGGSSAGNEYNGPGGGGGAGGYSGPGGAGGNTGNSGGSAPAAPAAVDLAVRAGEPVLAAAAGLVF